MICRVKIEKHIFTNYIYFFVLFSGLSFCQKDCGLCPHPTSGIRLGFSGNTTNTDGIRLERFDKLKVAVPAFLFYRYWVRRSHIVQLAD